MASDSTSDLSKTPGSAALFPIDPPPTSRSGGLSKNFERPNYFLLFTHLILCGLAWPILYVFTLIARDKTLFWARLVVSMGGGIVGVSLGFTLLNLSKRFLEAASEHLNLHREPIY
jgi:hypothetical protein